MALSSQGLLTPSSGKGKKATLSVITQLGYVQIDTLSVVARAHHHTIWNRQPDYQEKYLGDLLEKDKSIFEYWSHAASYLPMSEFRFSLPGKKNYLDGGSHWFPQDKKVNKFVLDRIKSEGPLQSKDFEFKRNDPGNWYEWKPAKKALEQLFMEGKLMVAKRQGFQKVYDLAERVLPADVDTSMPNEKEVANYLINKAIQAHGLINEKEISYLRKGSKSSLTKELKRMLSEGELIEISIDGFPDVLYVTTPQLLKDSVKLRSNDEVHLLSPFDNVLIQRKRLNRFFDFDYMIECYVPEPKRKFGYFCLPVLYGNRFVGRLDPKADRSTGTFHVKSMHFEKDFSPDEEFNNAFSTGLRDFAAFNSCDKIEIGKADKKWKAAIKPELK